MLGLSKALSVEVQAMARTDHPYERARCLLALGAPRLVVTPLEPAERDRGSQVLGDLRQPGGTVSPELLLPQQAMLPSGRRPQP